MKAEALLALFERVADAPEAIARLRRFVLDLAVRGKLVEQDARDEPASKALERIIAMRESVPTTARKSSPKQVADSISRLDLQIPPTWLQVPLSELVRVLNGRAYKRTELLHQGKTRVLRVGNLFTSDHWYFSDLDLEADKYCGPGDLIYAWSASFGPFIWTGPRVIYHYHIWKLDLFSEADTCKQFLHLYLQQKTREIKESGHGISMVHMTKEKMERLAVSLPPLAEQHRIVAKVNELMALLDRLQAARSAREATRDRLTTASLTRLTAAPDTDPEAVRTHARFALDALPALTTRTDQIKQLRQTILNLAVRGKLSEPFADASDLAAEAESDASAAPGIPAGWRQYRLSALLSEDTRNGYSRRPDDAKDGVPILRISAGTVRKDGLVAEEEHKLISAIDSATRDQYGLRRGDLLACRFNGNKAHVGRLSLFSNYLGLGPIYPDKLIRVRLNPELAIPAYIRLAGDSDLVRARVEQECATTVGNWGISASRLKEIFFPVPPLAEQHRIVARVDELMALCDRLEAALQSADTTRARLLEALLHEALASDTTERKAA